MSIYIVAGLVFVIGVIFLPPRVLLDTLSKDVFFYSKTSEKVIALTIDDALSIQTTPIVLATLRKHDIKATFFVIGEKASEFPNLLKIVYQQGHQLANHDWKDRCSGFIDTPRLAEDVEKTQLLLEPYRKEGDVKWFRPGCGFSNQAMLRMLSLRGFKCVL